MIEKAYKIAADAHKDQKRRSGEPYIIHPLAVAIILAEYELDKETGFIILDRILYTSTHYPANYGFIPRTYADDGDPLDVLLICAEAIEPMTLVRAYPIGVIKMIDNGKYDEKIIAIPFSDPNYNMYTDIDQLPRHIFEEMKHFFTVYKQLENK